MCLPTRARISHPGMSKSGLSLLMGTAMQELLSPLLFSQAICQNRPVNHKQRQNAAVNLPHATDILHCAAAHTHRLRLAQFALDINGRSA